MSAYCRVGCLEEPSGASEVTIEWRGAYASHLKILPTSEAVWVTLNPCSGGEGQRLMFPAKEAIELDDLYFCGFTIERPKATAFTAWWH